MFGMCHFRPEIFFQSFLVDGLWFPLFHVSCCYDVINKGRTHLLPRECFLCRHFELFLADAVLEDGEDLSPIRLVVYLLLRYALGKICEGLDVGD